MAISLEEVARLFNVPTRLNALYRAEETSILTQIKGVPYNARKGDGSAFPTSGSISLGIFRDIFYTNRGINLEYPTTFGSYGSTSGSSSRWWSKWGSHVVSESMLERFSYGADKSIGDGLSILYLPEEESVIPSGWSDLKYPFQISSGGITLKVIFYLRRYANRHGHNDYQHHLDLKNVVIEPEGANVANRRFCYSTSGVLDLNRYNAIDNSVWLPAGEKKELSTGERTGLLNVYMKNRQE